MWWWLDSGCTREGIRAAAGGFLGRDKFGWKIDTKGKAETDLVRVEFYQKFISEVFNKNEKLLNASVIYREIAQKNSTKYINKLEEVNSNNYPIISKFYTDYK